MKDYEAYLFDWDGTIAETLEVWVEILREAFAIYGLKPADDEIVSCIGNFVVRPKQLGIKENEYDEFSASVQQASFERIPNAPLYPGVEDTLGALHQQGKKLALVTSGWRRTIDVILAKHGLSSVFDVVITGDDVKDHKPHPAPLLAALDKLSVAKGDAVMVGDSDKDLGAAYAAELDSILFYPPSHQLFYSLDSLKNHEPTYIIDAWQGAL